MPTTIPTVTSGTRPSSPSAGDAYFETDTNKYIISDGSNWRTFNSDSIALASIANTKSVALDGTDDHVLIPNNTAYEFGTSDFSIVCWFYATNAISGYIGLYDFRPGGNGTYYPSIFLSNTSGTRYYYWNGVTVVANYNTTLSNGAWLCSTVTRTSGAIKLYLNGNEVATGTDSNNYSAPTSGIRVGQRGNNTLSLTGSVDEFAIFDKALNAAEVSNVYNGGDPVNLDPLEPLSWYRMGDGDTGTTVTDHGSLSNDASLTNDASFSTSPTAP